MGYLKNYISHLDGELARSIKETSEDVLKSIESKFTHKGEFSGLLLGNVQSGKTGQMLGVMASLADEGYKVFLLLTTDNVDLQRQTYNRVRDALLDFT